jgi:hypothetical protein
MDSRISRLALLALTVFLGLGCKGGDEEPPPYENPKITLANYESIDVGTTTEDAALALLGETFEKHYSVPDVQPLELDGEPVDAILYWKDESGGSTKEITVWVKDGVVIEKGQRGLKEPDAAADAADAASRERDSSELE